MEVPSLSCSPPTPTCCGRFCMVPTQGVFVAEILAMGWAALVLHSVNEAVCMALSVLVLEVVFCHLLSFLLFSFLPVA